MTLTGADVRVRCATPSDVEIELLLSGAALAAGRSPRVRQWADVVGLPVLVAAAAAVSLVDLHLLITGIRPG